METQARFTVIGLYALAVLSAGFAFVYWLNTSGGLGQRAAYRIRFDAPVSGLLKGSSVLFNGIRVGEVTALHLDATSPRDVLVDIAIEQRAPMRTDTKIGIEFQGLAGAPVISLAGGTPSLPLLASLNAKPPLLIAEKNAGQGMTQAARDVLQRIDAVVSDNAQPLKSMIASIDKFSGALARNSDRVDGILAGLERMTGGGPKVVPRIYDLAAAQVFPGLSKRPDGQLLVAEPTALSLFDNDKVLVRSSTVDKPVVDNAQWPDLLPKVIQTRIVQSFENAQYFRAMGKSPEGTRADFNLLIDIRGFHISAGSEVVAEVEIAAKIVGADGRIVDARTFRSTTPLAALDAPLAAKALNDSFAKVASEIVLWTCGAI